jgi:hypothetical protein
MTIPAFCVIPICLALLAGSAHAQAADNTELKQVYDADQKDRTMPVGKMDWPPVAARDATRRLRVKELLDQGQVRTGNDYERAAMVFQHGDGAPGDFLFAHILAVTAIGKGNLSARWLATATLDRYLQKIGQPQVFGTQFSGHTENGESKWTMEPYNRTLVSPQLREANCMPDPEEQAAMLLALSKGEEPKPPKHQPCSEK